MRHPHPLSVTTSCLKGCSSKNKCFVHKARIKDSLLEVQKSCHLRLTNALDQFHFEGKPVLGPQLPPSKECFNFYNSVSQKGPKSSIIFKFCFKTEVAQQVAFTNVAPLLGDISWGDCKSNLFNNDCTKSARP